MLGSDWSSFFCWQVDCQLCGNIQKLKLGIFSLFCLENRRDHPTEIFTDLVTGISV